MRSKQVEHSFLRALKLPRGVGGFRYVANFIVWALTPGAESAVMQHLRKLMVRRWSERLLCTHMVTIRLPRACVGNAATVPASLQWRHLVHEACRAPIRAHHSVWPPSAFLHSRARAYQCAYCRYAKRVGLEMREECTTPAACRLDTAATEAFVAILLPAIELALYSKVARLKDARTWYVGNPHRRPVVCVARGRTRAWCVLPRSASRIWVGLRPRWFFHPF